MRLSRNNEAVQSEAAADRLRAFLRGRGLRMTAEREALVRAALGRRRHFTLEELVREVVRRDTRASRATVYRSLPILVEAGILLPVLVSDEPRRFELALGRRHHDHLLCRRCGRVVEFRSPGSAVAERQHDGPLAAAALQLDAALDPAREQAPAVAAQVRLLRAAAARGGDLPKGPRS